MKTAIYIRVSTDEQAEEGFSIAAQKDRLISFCHSQGWEVVEIYIEEGKSAKDLDRPELQRLLDDSSQHRFDIVLVYKLDRLTRSVMDLYSLLQVFEKHNVKFKSATEVYDTTSAMGRLFITLVAALAQWERENLAERVRFGMEQMVKEGKRPGAKMPYGYDKEGNVITEEKAVLHRIRKMYMEGQGFFTISRQLNEMGITKRGSDWSTFSVYYVLDNPFYAGKIRWGSKKANGKYASRKRDEKVECIYQDSDHETIFTMEQYEEHSNEMKRRSFHGYSKKNEYWFVGALKCGRCGSSMTGRFKINKLQNGGEHKRIFYICSNRQQAKGCHMPMFQQRLVEKLVMDHIAAIKLNHKKIEELSETTHESNEYETELGELERELRKISERKKKWQYAYADDLMTVEELRQRNAEATEQEAFLRSRKEEIEVDLNQGLEEYPDDVVFELPELWEALDDKDKNQMIRKIFNTIVVDTPLEKGLGKKNQLMPAHIVEITFN